MSIFQESAVVPNFNQTGLVKAVQQGHIDKLKEEFKSKYDIRHMGEEKQGIVNLRIEFSLRKMKIDAPYRLILTCPNCQSLQYRQEFEIKRIGDVSLGSSWYKSRKELLSIVESLKTFLKSQNSQLLAVLTQTNSIKIYSHCILTSEFNNISFVLKQLSFTVHEFIAHLKYFHCVNFLTPPGSEINTSLRNKETEMIRKWISFFRNTPQQLTATQKERFYEEARQKRQIFGEPQQTGPEPICEGIKIRQETKASADKIKRFEKNLQINKAVQDNGTIKIVSIVYHLLSTFAFARSGDQKDKSHNEQPIGNTKRQTVIKKCCVLEKQRDSHRNEIFYLQRHGNQSCRFIVKYFLDKGEAPKGNKNENKRDQEMDPTKISIYSLFDGGDLYTDVMYPQSKEIWTFDLDDYLLIFLQLAKVVEFMVKNKILHRDIKPTNILLGVYRGRLIIKLIDFGSWASSSFTELEKNKYKDIIKAQKILRTTTGYNLSYKQAIKKDSSLVPAVKDDQFLAQKACEEYETHQNFDIFSVGATMKELLRISGISNQTLTRLINHCEVSNPNKRPNPTQLANRIVDMRVKHYMETVFLPRLRLEGNKTKK